MDYRPALRQRTGAGEYVHRLAGALQARIAPEDSLTVFSSSWKDRLDDGVGARGAATSTPACRSVLNLAWHRLEWPPVDWFAGPVDIAHSMHPVLLPARAAAQFVTIHDLYFLDRRTRPSPRYGATIRPWPRRHARRAAGVIVPRLHERQHPGRASVCRPTGSSSARRARRRGPRASSRRPTGRSCSSARSSPARTFRASSAPTRARPRRSVDARPGARRPGRPSGLGTGLAIDGVSIEGRVQATGYVDDARRLCALSSGVDARASVLRRGIRACRCSRR